MKTKKALLYETILNAGTLDNERLEELTGMSSGLIRKYKHLLFKEGYLVQNEAGLPEATERILSPRVAGLDNTKYETYREMLEIYMEDFRSQESFRDRLAVGQEIRMILKYL